MRLAGIFVSFLVSLCCCARAAVAAFFPQCRGEGRLFLDTADTQQWESLLGLGIFHGVTTNPTLLERAGQPCNLENVQKLARKALSQTDEFMCQSWGSTAQELYGNGMALSQTDRDRIVVKVPVTKTGLEAASLLVQAGVRVCLTACYDHQQAILAAGVGAEYIAPYLGRMTDAGKDGLEECKRMRDIAEGLNSETRILVASIREAESMALLAEHGLDTFTFSPDIVHQLLDEPLTDKAAADFEDAASRNTGSS